MLWEAVLGAVPPSFDASEPARPRRPYNMPPVLYDLACRCWASISIPPTSNASGGGGGGGGGLCTNPLDATTLCTILERIMATEEALTFEGYEKDMFNLGGSDAVARGMVDISDVQCTICQLVTAKKSGNIFRVGIFLDFVWLTTRTPRGAYARRARRNRIDRHGGGIERLALQDPVMVPCGHTFCSYCIKGWVAMCVQNHQDGSCPECRAQMGADQVTYGYACVVSRSVSPQWRSIRLRLAPRAYSYDAPRWGCIVRVVPGRRTKSRQTPTRKTLPFFFRGQVPFLAPLVQCRSSARLGSYYRSFPWAGTRRPRPQEDYQQTPRNVHALQDKPRLQPATAQPTRHRHGDGGGHGGGRGRPGGG